MKTINQQFSEVTKIKIFEIPVIDKRTGESEYITFNIDVNEDKLQATHESLTEEQSKSNKIAFVSVDIDEDFSLDSHLENLYEECINAIVHSDFFEFND